MRHLFHQTEGYLAIDFIGCPSYLRRVYRRHQKQTAYALLTMYTRSWQIIRDDSKKTFEVCDQVSDTNHFTNAVHGMQKAGMIVSCMTPPVSNKNSSKTVIKIPGYNKEDGLHERLLKEYREKTRKDFEQWEE